MRPDALPTALPMTRFMYAPPLGFIEPTRVAPAKIGRAVTILPANSSESDTIEVRTLCEPHFGHLGMII